MNRAQYLRSIGNDAKARMHEEHAETNYGFGGGLDSLGSFITRHKKVKTFKTNGKNIVVQKSRAWHTRILFIARY